MYTDWYPYATHLDCTGGTQSGKTSWLQHCERQRLKSAKPPGFCAIAFDQKHYDRLLEFIVYLDPKLRVITLDLSNQSSIVPCNWITNPNGEETGAHADRIANAIAGVLGAKNLDQMQNYAGTMTTLVRWCVETKQPVQTAFELLDFQSQSLRERALQMTRDPFTRRGLAELLSITRFGDWTYRVGSSWNRLREFENSVPLRRFTAADGALDIPAEVRNGSVILVNAAVSDTLKRDAAAMFTGLLLSEFTRASGRYYLDLDEAQLYMNYDIVSMLDTMAKRGLRLSLLHHTMGQFPDERVRASLERNCGIKIYFSGDSRKERLELVPELLSGPLNERQIKDVFHRLETSYIEREYEEESGHEGGSSGDTTYDEVTTFSENATWGTTTKRGTRFEPEQRRVESGIIEAPMDEKLSRLAEELKLGKRECWVKLPDRAYKTEVPDLKRHLLPPEYLLRFMGKHACGITPSEADSQYEKSRGSFIGESHATRSRKTQKKALAPL